MYTQCKDRIKYAGFWGLRILDFGFVARRLAAEVGWRLMRGRRVRHGQYERRLLSATAAATAATAATASATGRRLELPAQLSEPEQHGRLLRTGTGRVDHGRKIRVHQLGRCVAWRQSKYPCNKRGQSTRFKSTFEGVGLFVFVFLFSFRTNTNRIQGVIFSPPTSVIIRENIGKFFFWKFLIKYSSH